MARGESGTVRSEQGGNWTVPGHGDPLLRTKLFIPPPRARRVERAALIDCLNAGLDKPLILVSAPAGFGKSTLLAAWATQATIPVAWLSLGPEENDPPRFLRYLIAALDGALRGDGPSICATSAAMLQSVQPIPIRGTLITLINELNELSKPFALVLDDFQFVTNPAVHEAFGFIVDHLPPHAHLLLASRVDPPLPLHRLRAAQHLLEIRTQDLRFSEEEAAAFLNQVMGLTLSGEDVSALNVRAEGWAVGLQMAALSMQSMTDRSAFVQAFSGSNRFVLEYLIEEVLDRQPDELQEFLLQTSVLDRLCAPLCDAVLGKESESQGILEHLEHSNLFLTPLDQAGHWYRFHQLFADLLRARLCRSQPESVSGLHLRASRWLEGAGLVAEAIQHAFAAGAPDRVARLVERHGLDVLSRGEMSTLLGWFDALPAGRVRCRPALCILHAWALTFSGHLSSVEPELQAVEQQVGPCALDREAQEILGSAAIIRALIADFRGDMTSAVDLAQRADRLLPQENLTARSIVPFVLGDGYTATSELDRAEAAFEEIRRIGQASGNLWTTAVALHKLALLKKLQGKLGAAFALYHETIKLAGDRRGRQFGSMGATYVGLGDLLRERNQLEAAWQMVTQAIKSMEHWPNPTDLVNGYLTLARILLSRQDIQGAEGALADAEAVGSPGGIFPRTRKTLEACQMRVWLAKGDLTMAGQWAQEKGLEKGPGRPDSRIDYLDEMEWISMARLLIARGEWDRSLAVLVPLADTARRAGRNGGLIEILVLTALALYGSGKVAQASDCIVKCLALAEPEGYLRIFLDEGGAMRKLLLVCGRSAEPHLQAYFDQILDAFSVSAGEEAGSQIEVQAPQRLVEPLTGREMEVLRLLVAGLSNREIAARLYLSEGTVKTHTHHLYAKLGVQSRTGAIARAGVLHLL